MLDEPKYVSIINGMGVVEPGYMLISEHKDRGGLISVSKDDRVIRIHPSRICDDGTSGSMLVVSDGHGSVMCQCGEIVNVYDDKEDIVCSKCENTINVVGTVDNKIKVSCNDDKKSGSVDLDELANIGEVWVKESNFSKNTKLTSVVLRINNRYFQFNLYNMSFGKKDSTTSGKLDRFISDQSNGYSINNIDKWTEERLKRGYSIYTS